MAGKRKATNISTAIGLRIKKFRKKMQLKGVDCSKILGIPPSRLSDWESGQTSFTADQIFMIAEKLKISPTWLLAGQEAGEDSPPLDVDIHTVKKLLQDGIEILDGVARKQATKE